MFPSNLIRLYGKAFRFVMFFIIVQAVAGISCAPVKPINLSPEVVPGAQRFNGTVNVQFMTILTIPVHEPWERHPYVDRFRLKTATEESITKNNLFTGIVEKNPDYILDVWVDYQHVHAPGFGKFWVGVSSVWRLTKVSDGEMHGSRVEGLGIVTKGMGPSTRSLAGALQSMIINGLISLSDPSMARYISIDETLSLRELSIAEYMGKNNLKRGHSPTDERWDDYLKRAYGKSAIDLRPHIEPWINYVRKNWGKLQAGMKIEEVEEKIGPVRTSGAVLDVLHLKTKDLPARSIALWRGSDRISWTALLKSSDDNIIYKDFQCRSGIYTLQFFNDGLLSWKLYQTE